MLKYLKNKKGWAMTLVLIIIVVVPILGTTLYMYSSSAMKYAQIYKDREQARYLARSGAEAVMKIWKASAEVGVDITYQSIETVYYHPNGTFTLEEEGALGAIDVVIGPGDVDNSYRIAATCQIENIVQTFTVITSPITTADDLTNSWYVVDYQSDPLELSSGSISTTMEIEGTTYSATKFEEDGVVTITRPKVNGIDEGFTVAPDSKLELSADAIFFSNDLILFDKDDRHDDTITALKINATYTVFEGRVTLGSLYTKTGVLIQYGTLILETTDDKSIEIDGETYSMVYFDEGVYSASNKWKGNKVELLEPQIIPPGGYYVKKIDGGLDLISWFYSQNNSDEKNSLIEMEPDDENIAVPSALFIVEFIYE